MQCRWRIELLGGLRATAIDDAGSHHRVVTRFRTQKTGALLAYLAYHLRRSHLREALIELLWPECDLSAGRNNLSRELSALRDQLEPPGGVVLADRTTIQLHPEAVTTDVAEFEAALHAAARAARPEARAELLARAVELYQGELLPGDYHDWAIREKERLAEAYLQAIRQLIAHRERSGDLDRALQYARRAVSADPLHEEAHRDVMRLLAATGQPAAALRHYRELERTLRQELDTPPEAASTALARELERQAHLGPPARRSSPSSQEPVTQRGHAPQEPDALLRGGDWSADAVPCGPQEPIGGALPVDSPFYVVRATDGEFRAAIARRDSIVLVKGARQMGKTSLLARGLQQAREAGARVLLTDFQKLNEADLESVEALFVTLAAAMADQLYLEVLPEAVWNPRRGPNTNFERYLRREVLGKIPTPIVWGLDEVDRLFGCDFGSEVFGLFRSWFNERSLDPGGPWARFTLAMAYATEAHLFIADLNQSPFNVGTRLVLEDFTGEEVEELNARHGSPLRDAVEVARLHGLLSGHPYLTQRALYEMAKRGAGIAALEAEPDRDEGIFADHLRRILVSLSRDPELCEVVRGVLRGLPCPTAESFYRLRSAGVLTGESARDARLRCRLYQIYLERHLR